ncbi:MAG: bacillithiol biosynthesis BshC, partial [Candidatus Korarchaeota archaeon]|nr:bacillithiol biosynthesis BshC [Candidatus Thorarchaeota archaeon]NIW52344.1 bacillithiol biosynthesis BshC [Candidatus Korarchaeota archaeon]
SIIEEEGYRPQIGYRGRDYVPFFFECMNNGCNRNRVELKYIKENTQAYIRGICNRCEEEYSFNINPSKPDLSDIIDWISPRVDSRQIIVDSVLPVLAHIGGPGETSYYAEVIPSAEYLGIPFPIFLRYTRTFYNTPWNNHGAKELEILDLPTLTEKRLFNSISLWVEGRNNQDSDTIREAHQKIHQAV